MRENLSDSPIYGASRCPALATKYPLDKLLNICIIISRIPGIKKGGPSADRTKKGLRRELFIQFPSQAFLFPFTFQLPYATNPTAAAHTASPAQPLRTSHPNSEFDPFAVRAGLIRNRLFATPV